MRSGRRRGLGDKGARAQGLAGQGDCENRGVNGGAAGPRRELGVRAEQVLSVACGADSRPGSITAGPGCLGRPLPSL